MNGINRRGMKVVCVQELDLISSTTGRSYPGAMPRLNEIYTVLDFIDNTGAIVSMEGDPDCTAGVELLEISCPMSGRQIKPMGWPIVCFRPAEERKTDISALVGLTARQKEPA